MSLIPNSAFRTLRSQFLVPQPDSEIRDPRSEIRDPKVLWTTFFKTEQIGSHISDPSFLVPLRVQIISSRNSSPGFRGRSVNESPSQGRTGRNGEGVNPKARSTQLFGDPYFTNPDPRSEIPEPRLGSSEFRVPSSSYRPLFLKCSRSPITDYRSPTPTDRNSNHHPNVQIDRNRTGNPDRKENPNEPTKDLHHRRRPRALDRRICATQLEPPEQHATKQQSVAKVGPAGSGHPHPDFKTATLYSAATNPVADQQPAPASLSAAAADSTTGVQPTTAALHATTAALLVAATANQHSSAGYATTDLHATAGRRTSPTTANPPSHAPNIRRRSRRGCHAAFRYLSQPNPRPTATDFYPHTPTAAADATCADNACLHTESVTSNSRTLYQ